MREIVMEATVLDGTHLVLNRSLPEDWGQRLLVRIAPMPAESEFLLRELEAAYLTMSERERQAEVALVEELPREIESPWWE